MATEEFWYFLTVGIHIDHLDPPPPNFIEIEPVVSDEPSAQWAMPEGPDGGDLFLGLLRGERRFEQLSASQHQTMGDWIDRFMRSPEEFRQWLTTNGVTAVTSPTPPVAFVPLLSECSEPRVFAPLTAACYGCCPTGDDVSTPAGWSNVELRCPDADDRPRRWWMRPVAACAVAATGVVGGVGTCVALDDPPQTVSLASDDGAVPQERAERVVVDGRPDEADDGPVVRAPIETLALDLGDYPDDLDWYVVSDPDQRGVTGFCDAPGERGLGDVDDVVTVSGIDRAARRRLDESVYRYVAGIDASSMPGRVLASASCGSWQATTSGGRVVEHAATVRDDPAPDGATAGVWIDVVSTPVDGPGGAPQYGSHVVFSVDDAVVHASAAATDAAGARALLDALIPSIVARADGSAPPVPSVPQADEWRAYGTRVVRGALAQLGEISYGTSLEDYAAGLATYRDVLAAEATLLQLHPPPAELREPLARLIELTDQAVDVVTRQADAAAAGDREAATAIRGEGTPINREREALSIALGLQPPKA